jgi:hypothetical protein
LADIERDQGQGNGISRRKVLKGIGAATAIAWTTPIITSIGTRAYAASGPGCATSLSDSFESDGCGLGHTDLVNFAVTDGNVDVIGAECGYDFQPGNGHYIDLDGTPCASHSRLESKATFCEGRYQLSFRLAGANTDSDSNNTTTVTFGPYSASFSYPVGQPFTLTSVTVTLASPSSLVFDHDSGAADCMGMLLDDVNVTPI